MADPVLVDCPEGAFTKVATDVTVGEIYQMIRDEGPYLYSYRETGEAAPTDKSEAVPIFLGENNIVLEIWERSAGIDIYIWCDSTPGQVRLDV